MATDLVEKSDNPYGKAWLIAAEGYVDYFAGNFQSAALLLEKAAHSWLEETTGNYWEISSCRLFSLFSWAHQGKLRTLDERLEEYLRDAKRRGDRYFETSLVRYEHYVHLLHGRPEIAKSELARTLWPTPKGAFHVQDWFELEARCQISMYEDDSRNTLTTEIKTFRDLEHSLLLRCQIVRVVAHWLKARLFIAAALKNPASAKHNLSQGTKLCNKLDKEKNYYL